jgi:DNA-binding SARP family transcriptional activator/tetratricopeptide (TPR) repeat protein
VASQRDDHRRSNFDLGMPMPMPDDIPEGSSPSSEAGPETGMYPLYFELLGPISIVYGAKRKQLSSHRQRIILAALLLSANRVVPVDSLIDAVWDERPPATARSQVYICMTAIRGALRKFVDDELILTEPTGYILRLEPEQIDVNRFERMRGAAADMAGHGQIAEAVAIQRRALGMWRGRALSGVSSPLTETHAARLNEDRLVAQDVCSEWELRLGHHREMISELAERVATNPLREISRAQLMLALHRSGRQAEALEIYRRGRQELIDQLGLEPGEELRRMETLILSDDAGLQLGEPTGGAVVAPIRQLPTDTADFVGRDAMVEEISGMLGLATDTHPGMAVPIVVVSGLGGVGKSALAVHVAHLLANRQFPDGQLYVDLGGPNARPRQPGGVLARVLRAFGIYGASIPDDEASRAELYRSLLADRRVLVVIEDATSEAQVRPLLPGSPSCAVLITSRHRLTGLVGARHVDIEAFEDKQAAELLGKIIGVPRVVAERTEVAELTRLVDGLPLALRIIGARLAAHPRWQLRHMVRLLSSESSRLNELTHRDLAVRTTISLSYTALPPDEQMLLRLLCELDTDGIPGWIAAAALDVGQAVATRLLDNLANANLIRMIAGESVPGRYQMHDLVRIFAAEKAAADPADLHRRAQERIWGGWLWLAERAHERLYGGQYTVMHGTAPRWAPAASPEELETPLHWLDSERINLRAAVRDSAAAGLDEVSWDLAMTLVTLFEARTYVTEWEETHHEALAAVRKAGNRRGEAAMLCSLGSLYLTRGQVDKAQAVLIPALRTFMELDDTHGKALTIRNIASMHYRKGEYQLAQQHYRQALGDFRLLGDQIGEAHALIRLAGINLAQNQVDSAVAQLDEALRLSRVAGHRRTEAQAQHRMGEALIAQGEFRAAGEMLRGTLTMVRGDGDRIGQMHVLRTLGRMHLALGQPANAEYCARGALTLARQMGDRQSGDQIQSELTTMLSRMVSDRGAYLGRTSTGGA